MQEIIRCDVCGEHATRFIGKSTLPICDNNVCYHTRIEEVNAEIKVMISSEKDEEVEV